MRRIRIVGLCLVAAFALGAFAASAASAAPPEIGRCLKETKAGEKAGYKTAACDTAEEPAGSANAKFSWNPGAVKNKFTGHGGTSTLETVGKSKVVCEEENATGEYTGTKTVGNIHVEFGPKCTAEGTFTCKSKGSKEGELNTNPLKGELHFEKGPAKKKIALDLVPASGELFIEFECGPLTIKVRGSILVNVKADKMEEKPIQKYSGLKGKQKPEFYEEVVGKKTFDFLESNSTGTYEKAGQTVTNDQTNEEKLEANAVV